MIEKFELKHKKRRFIFDVMIIILIIVFIMIYSFVFFLIGEFTGFRYMFYIEFVSLIIIAVFFTKKMLIEFDYYLEKRRIRVDRIYSKRPKLDIVIEMKNVAYMGSLKDMPASYKSYKIQKETFKSIDEKTFCIVHLVEKKYFTAALSPSYEFTEKILKRWNDFINNNQV